MPRQRGSAFRRPRGRARHWVPRWRGDRGSHRRRLGFDEREVPEDRIGLRTSIRARIQQEGGTVRLWSTRARAPRSCSPCRRAANEPHPPLPAGGRPDRGRHRCAGRRRRRRTRVGRRRHIDGRALGRGRFPARGSGRDPVRRRRRAHAALSAAPSNAPFTLDRLYIVVALATAAAIAEFIPTVGTESCSMATTGRS